MSVTNKSSPFFIPQSSYKFTKKYTHTDTLKCVQHLLPMFQSSNMLFIFSSVHTLSRCITFYEWKYETVSWSFMQYYCSQSFAMCRWKQWPVVKLWCMYAHVIFQRTNWSSSMHFLLNTRTHVAWGQGRTNRGLWVTTRSHKYHTSRVTCYCRDRIRHHIHCRHRCSQ